MTDLEKLSLLLDGELPPDEASALEARIETDPELDAAWEAMRALPGDLAGLGELDAPPVLDHRVVGPPAQERKPPSAGIAIAALAAVLLMWFVGANEAPTMLLEGGSQLVEGKALVYAGNTRVQVDGTARVSVEPLEGGARVPAQEVSMKNALAGAIAGAIVTVAVYEGSAQVIPDGEAATISLAAGESHTVGTPSTPSPQRKIVVRSAADPDGDGPATLDDALEHIAALEAALAETNFENAITKGQLTARQGEPIRWPDEATAWDPEPFAEKVKAGLAGQDELSLFDIDCSEYPCIALIEGGDAEDWDDSLKAAVDAMTGEDDARVSLNVSRVGTDDGEVKMAALAIAEPNEGDGQDLSTRVGWRSESLVEAAVDELMPEE